MPFVADRSQVSAIALLEYRQHMRPEEFMDGLTIIAVDPKDNKLVGFAACEEVKPHPANRCA